MPKLSFVVPTKNRVEWLPECLSGLLAQTVKDIEVVVVNDGSSDGTKELLDGHYAKDSRVKIVHNKISLGAGMSRNLGNQLAESPILAVCDDDDVYPLERAERVLSFFEKNPSGAMMTSPYVRIDYFDRILEKFDGCDFDEKAFKETGAISYFCHPAAAYTKKDITELGGYHPETKDKTDDLQLVEDWIKSGRKIVFAPEHYLCMHRVLPRSIMASMRGFRAEWATK